jgi:AcrR family transcriptional regulator
MQPGIRRPTAERRAEIAAAALRIIGERGLTSLTTTTLAAEIGVTSGALFRHFASRDAILAESVRHAVGRIESTFPDPGLPPIERVLGLARNRVRLLGGDPGLAWLLRSDQAYLALPDDAVARLRAVVSKTRRYLLGAIRAGAGDGSIRADIEPAILVLNVMGTVHASVGLTGLHRTATHGVGPSPERVVSALESLLAPPLAAAPARRGEKSRGRIRRKK